MGTDSSVVAARGWRRGLRNYGLLGTEFQFSKRKVFWRQTVVMAAHQCTYRHRTAHLKMAEMVSFMLCAFYNKKIILKRREKKNRNLKSQKLPLMTLTLIGRRGFFDLLAAHC